MSEWCFLSSCLCILKLELNIPIALQLPAVTYICFHPFLMRKLIMLKPEIEPEWTLSFLPQVDALQNDAALDQAKPNCSHPNSEISKEVKLGDVAKDLNKIKRQNMITHILLGTVIVMTAVWQFNEVSFLLAVKRKLSNPFKSLGDLIKSSLKGRGKPMIEAPPLPPVGVPDVTRNDLPLLLISNGNGNNDDWELVR